MLLKPKADDRERIHAFGICGYAECCEHRGWKENEFVHLKTMNVEKQLPSVFYQLILYFWGKYLIKRHLERSSSRWEDVDHVEDAPSRRIGQMQEKTLKTLEQLVREAEIARTIDKDCWSTTCDGSQTFKSKSGTDEDDDEEEGREKQERGRL